jgi:hypothetical protein
VPCPGRHVAGRRRASRCGARLCISVSVFAGRPDRAYSKRVRECARGLQASSRRARVGKASRTHQVQSPGTTARGQERTASSGATAGPTESRGEPERWRLLDSPSLFPSRHPEKGIKSNQEKRTHHVFSSRNKTQASPRQASLHLRIHSSAPPALASQPTSE